MYSFESSIQCLFLNDNIAYTLNIFHFNRKILFIYVRRSEVEFIHSKLPVLLFVKISIEYFNLLTLNGY